MPSRRAQIEIMGLLFIVVLLTAGILFSLSFLVGRDTTARTTTKDSILAETTLATLRKTSTDCHERTVEELLIDCARTHGSIPCGTQNTCQKADATIQDILRALGDALSRDTHLRIIRIPYFEGMNFGTPCRGAYESSQHYVPVGIGYDIEMALDICRT